MRWEEERHSMAYNVRLLASVLEPSDCGISKMYLSCSIAWLNGSVNSLTLRPSEAEAPLDMHNLRKSHILRGSMLLSHSPSAIMCCTNYMVWSAYDVCECWLLGLSQSNRKMCAWCCIIWDSDADASHPLYIYIYDCWMDMKDLVQFNGATNNVYNFWRYHVPGIETLVICIVQ